MYPNTVPMTSLTNFCSKVASEAVVALRAASQSATAFTRPS
jgi:hypothetical protein